MTQFECTQCGQLGRFSRHAQSEFVAECPVCEEPTRWERAFEGEGIEF